MFVRTCPMLLLYKFLISHFLFHPTRIPFRPWTKLRLAMLTRNFKAAPSATSDDLKLIFVNLWRHFITCCGTCLAILYVIRGSYEVLEHNSRVNLKFHTPPVSPFKQCFAMQNNGSEDVSHSAVNIFVLSLSINSSCMAMVITNERKCHPVSHVEEPRLHKAAVGMMLVSWQHWQGLLTTHFYPWSLECRTSYLAVFDSWQLKFVIIDSCVLFGADLRERERERDE